MMILAIESSCDDTCAAVLAEERKVLSSVVSSQVELHGLYGGVVPELASRRHCENIRPVVEEALRRAGVRLGEIGALAVTRGPGLVGSLLVGVAYAKSLACARGVPLVGVHHIEGHLLSPLLTNPELEFPYLGLVVSGGHTSLFRAAGWGDYELLGRTIDDAAGEAFDKVARMLGLGFPGGPAIERCAAAGDPAAVPLPRAWLGRDSLDFSFSGLKTAVRTALERRRCGGVVDAAFIADLAASFQEAVCAVLVGKSLAAAARCGVRNLVLAGGVACNGYLRRRLRAEAEAAGYRLFLAPPRFCTDNAAMIGLAGARRLAAGERHGLALNPASRLELG